MGEAPICCPACGGAIGTDESGRLPAQCPHCRQLLVVDDQAEEEREQTPAEESELEEVRIRRIVRERRAVVRTRGYYIVLMLACIVMAMHLLTRIVVEWGSGYSRLVGQAAGIVLLAYFAVRFRGRVKELTTQMHATSLPEPKGPPDFTGLSDGQQQSENLRKYHEGER